MRTASGGAGTDAGASAWRWIKAQGGAVSRADHLAVGVSGAEREQLALLLLSLPALEAVPDWLRDLAVPRSELPAARVPASAPCAASLTSLRLQGHALPSLPCRRPGHDPPGTAPPVL